MQQGRVNSWAVRVYEEHSEGEQALVAANVRCI